MKFKNIFWTVVVLGGIIAVGLFGWSIYNNEGDSPTMYEPADSVTVSTTKREESQSKPESSESESVDDYKEQPQELETTGSESESESDVDVDVDVDAGVDAGVDADEDVDVDADGDVDVDELNYAVSQEVSEAREYHDLMYPGYAWVNYVDDLYITDNMMIVVNATQEIDPLEDYQKVEVINEIQKVVGVAHFKVSDEDIYGNLPVVVYNDNGELIAESSFETPRDIELY